jgi:hypothetical protein
MRGWTSFLVGFLLLGLAVWSFSADGLGSSALLFAAGAAFFVYCGAHGREVSETGDPTAVIDFVKDPADAIVDSATERLADWLKEPQSAADEPARFDPDAVIARYIENRGAESTGQLEITAPIQGFGRKGL